jgi:hypothetical protein
MKIELELRDDMTTHEVLDEIVSYMTAQEYHLLSIYRAIDDKRYELKEYISSIMSFKEGVEND